MFGYTKNADDIYQFTSNISGATKRAHRIIYPRRPHLSQVQPLNKDTMSANRIRVLCVTDFFIPGFKGGGLIRTVENMCSAAMSSDIDFWVFTRDRDLEF